MKKIALYIIILIVLVVIISIFKAQDKVNCSTKNVSIVRADNGIADSIFHGNHQTIVIFFSPYCDLCSAEIDEIVAEYAQFSDVDVVFVSDEGTKTTLEYADKHLLFRLDNCIVGCDLSYEFRNIYDVYSPPTSFVFSSNGELVLRHVGAIAARELIKYIKL